MADQAPAAGIPAQAFDPMFQLNLTLQELVQTKEKYVRALENENQLLKEKIFAIETAHNNAQENIQKLQRINQMAINAAQTGKPMDPSKI